MLPRAALLRLTVPARRASVLEHARGKLPPWMSAGVEVADELERTALGKTPGVPGPGDVS